MKIEIPHNDVLKQSNYNYLLKTKENIDVFIIETPVGIGTLYNLRMIHGVLATVTIAVDSPENLDYANLGRFEKVIIDIKKDSEILDEDIIEKMKSIGFKKIIIVKSFVA